MEYRTKLVARGLVAVLIPTAMVACGGGSDSSPAAGAAAAPAAMKVSGTAATGAAMANASVSVTCAAGSGTATTGANGTYTATVSGGALPCVLSVTSSDGKTVLHSVLPGSGHTDATANITPLSELLIAQLSGIDPQSFAAGFSAATTISAAELAAAQAALLQMLTAAGVDTSGVGDIVGGGLTAGSGTGYDGVLDKLQATLAGAGATLADLASAVSTSSKTGSTAGAAVIGTVLARSAPDCPGLKTGTLRYVAFLNGQNGTMQVDADALKLTVGGNAYQLAKNASCDYLANDAAGTRILVARSGAAVVLQGTGLTGVAGIAIPEQKLDVAALGGSYNRVSYGATFDADEGDFGDTEFAADGQNGLAKNCPQGYGTCATDTESKGKLAANPSGGFDYVENGTTLHRVFAFRDGSGKTLMLAQAATGGTVAALVSKAKLALPALSRVASFWQFTLNNAGLSAVSEDANTVTAADSATGVVTRSFPSDGHFDTLTYNTPFDGTRYRATNACTTSAGAASTCNGVVQLPFGGLVLTASSVPGKHFLSVSLDKP
ncbi:hypothetical protein ACKI2N_007720 [Cupriavidus sp. 30B13]|uniref:hypothetical protein n=1 Tax=Cupriavidus sp. 30B13 TaxID=3384241 RepID=UPI003B8FA925